MTKTDQESMLKAMKEQLRWRDGDVATISAMADIYEEMGDEEQASALRAAAAVAGRMNKSRLEAKRLEEEFQGRLKLVFTEQSKLKKECPHPVTQYYPDASGNNDSTTTCLCCGADL